MVNKYSNALAFVTATPDWIMSKIGDSLSCDILSKIVLTSLITSHYVLILWMTDRINTHVFYRFALVQVVCTSKCFT